MTTDIGFGLSAAIIVISALFVVRSTNLIHAVLWLAMSLLGTAALYAFLEAPFLAGVQVLTYVGGVVTLLIFGVMVTRRHEGAEAPIAAESDERGFLVAVALLAGLGIAIWKTEFTLPASPPPQATTAQLASLLLKDYLIAFEALSLLLLAAIVGAVVIARRKEPNPVTGRESAAEPARAGQAAAP
jgi:NADH-quinone oxidoreductase subunit J